MNTLDRITGDPRWSGALVVLAAIAVYANSLMNGFALDDVWIIQNNPRVIGPGSAAEIWLTPYWPTLGEQLGLYRPLAIAGYAVQWALGDGAPWIFHAVNVALHALVSLLVFVFLRRCAEPFTALFGALLFAVHPLHTEAVANVVGQAELISAAAVLAGVCIHLRSLGGRTGAGAIAAIAACYTFGLLAKEHTIVLPGLIVAADYAAGRGPRVRAAIAPYVRKTAPLIGALAMVAAAYLALRYQVLGSIGGTDAGPQLPFLKEDARIYTAFRAWPEFVRLLILPLDLSSDYSPAVILPATELTGQTLFGALILIAVAAAALLTPRHPRFGAPAAWLFIAVLPISNLLFPIGVVVAERTLYLASVAAALAAAFLLEVVPDPRRMRTGVLTAGVGLLLLFSWRTVTRNPSWDSTATVTQTLIDERPESYRAQWTAAVDAWNRGDRAAADRHWELAYAIWPHDSQFLTEFGRYNISIGRHPRAVDVLERSLTLHPEVTHHHVTTASALDRRVSSSCS